jgi:hypothetical protein
MVNEDIRDSALSEGRVGWTCRLVSEVKGPDHFKGMDVDKQTTTPANERLG